MNRNIILVVSRGPAVDYWQKWNLCPQILHQERAMEMNITQVGLGQQSNSELG
jgi:hypothetical protein